MRYSIRFLLVALLFAQLPIAASAADLFVSPTGNDAATGTISAPLRTIRKAVSKAVAGTTIQIRAGTYRERIVFPRSGSATGGFIAVRNYSTEKVIIDANGVSGNHIFYMWAKNYIRIQGLEIMNNLNVSDGSVIRVEGSGNQIQILNNVIHETTGEDAMGITFYGSIATNSIRNVVVRGNLLYNINPGWSETMTFNGNVENITVEGNTIRDVGNIGIDFIGGEGMCSDPLKDVARNAVCRGNTVRNARSPNEAGYAAGIYVDGGQNVTIDNNSVSYCDLGIEVGAENPGSRVTGVKVRNNVIFHNDKSGLIFGGYEFSRGRVVGCEFSNNTLYQNDTMRTGAGEICIQYAENNKLESNIVWPGAANVYIYSEAGNVGTISNYNVYYSTLGAANAQFTWRGGWSGTFAGYQSKSRQDLNSIFADPQFVDAAGKNFHIQATSPALNAGNPTLVSTTLLDFDGQLRVARGRVDAGIDEVQ